PDHALKLLDDPSQNVVVNLVGVPLADRPIACINFLARLHELRGRSGHPHWIVLDEAHHVLPSSWEPSRLTLPKQLDRMLFITLDPKLVTSEVLLAVDTIV